MNSRAFQLVLCILLTSAVVSAATAQSINLRLPDGSRWNGTVGDHVEVRFVDRNAEMIYEGEIVNNHELYVQINTEITGEMRVRTIFKGDIRAIRTIEPEAKPETTGPRRESPRSGSRSDREPAKDDAPGVIVLPLTGMVGIDFRHQEIDRIGEYADRYGPGQIIILKIDSGGGMVVEMERIAQSVVNLKRRHRVIAWIDRAISAGAATAAFCDEIYFTTQGSLGSMTMVRGATGVEEELQLRWVQYARRWFREGNRDPRIAQAMIMERFELSYDKDPESGRITWHDNLSGEFILSRRGQNLSFNASNAVHSGFAQGIADTEADLARLLDMPEWREISDRGRRMHAEWLRNVEQARVEIPRAFQRYQFLGTGSGDPIERIGHQIRQLEVVIQWMERAPNVAQFEFGLPDRDWFERQIAELRKRLADMRRGGGRR